MSTISITCPNEECEGEIVREVEVDPGEPMVWGLPENSHPGTGPSCECIDELPDACPHCKIVWDAGQLYTMYKASAHACSNFDFNDGGDDGPDPDDREYDRYGD